MSGMRSMAQRHDEESARVAIGPLAARFPHVLLTLDAGSVICAAAGDVESLLGYRSDELVGMDVGDLWGQASCGPAWTVHMASCRTKAGLRWKTFRRSAPVFAPDGSLLGSMELLADALRAGPAEAVEQQQVLRTQKLEALGMLASGIAHDFNNLLQAIDGHAMLALGGVPASMPARANLDHVLKATSRGAQLVRRILAFGRSEEPEPQRVDLCDVVRESLGLLAATLPSTITLRTQFAPGRLGVLASPSLLQQVVVNLAMNARHAIGSRAGTIEIAVQAAPRDAERSVRLGLREGSQVVLRVRDDGCGMSPALRARVFEPVFTTKSAGNGTGLGLAVVREIVTNAGGAIDIESEAGVGTTICIYLPRSGNPAPVLSGRDVPRGKGEHVLYVDDDPVLVTLGKSVLESLRYRVTACVGPQDALEAFSARPHAFDIMLTDVSMPALSGFELTRHIHALRPELPVLVMSGWVGPEEHALTQEVGAREILLKPVGMAEFARALARNLRTA